MNINNVIKIHRKKIFVLVTVFLFITTVYLLLELNDTASENRSLKSVLYEWNTRYNEKYDQGFELGRKAGYKGGALERWLEDENYEKGYEDGIEQGIEICIDDGLCFSDEGEYEYEDDRWDFVP